MMTSTVQQNPSDGADETKVQPEQRAILGAARAAAARGDLKAAISRFEEYLRLNPKDHKVRREYAGVLVRAKEMKQAIEQYERLLKALPDSSEIHLDLANAYLQIRQAKKAIPHLLIAQKSSPQDLEIATRLAQAYVGDNDPRNARIIVEQLLSRLRPGDPRVPTSFGRLLLDLKRPKLALTFLLPLRAKKPEDAELLADVIRAKGWLGEREEASRLIAELAGRDRQDIKLRLALADALFRLREFQLAGMVFDQALQIDPKDLRVLVGLARVNIQMFNIQPAAAFLECCQADMAPPELLALARGELYLTVGKYAEAIQVLRAYLLVDGDDVDCRATLAQVYEATGDYEKAKAEWAKLGLLKGQSEIAAVGIARVLGTQWRFAESGSLCERILAEEPESFLAVAQLVYNFGKMKKMNEAVAIAQDYLNRPHEDDNGLVVVGLSLGRVLLEAHRFDDAIPIYEQLLSSPLGRVGAAYFGLFYARRQLHHAEGNQEVLQAVLEGTLRDQMELADAAAVFKVNDLIIDLCNGVLAKFPGHLPSLLRLGEAQLSLARLDAHIDATVATCKVILGISPTNVRGRFILARAYALAKAYPLAFQEYHKLIKTDPDLLQARKESARTLYSAYCYAESHRQYGVAQYPTAEEVLRDALSHLSPDQPGAAPPGPDLTCPPPTPPDAISKAKAEIPERPPAAAQGPAAKPGGGWQAAAKGSAAKPEGIRQVSAAKPEGIRQVSAEEPAAKQEVLPPPRRVPADEAAAAGELAKDPAELEEECQRKRKRVEIDAEARAAEVKAVHEEQVAKDLKGLRNYKARDAYLRLLANQPDNTTAMFDLAQVYGSINQTRPFFSVLSQLPVAAPTDPAPSGLTRAAISQTSQLLQVDPYNRDAAVFQDWAQMALQPRLRPQVDLFSQNGRNGLSRIEIDGYSAQAIVPFGDEGDYIGIGYSNVALIPHNYAPLLGYIPSLLFGKQLTDRLRFISQTNIEQYQNRISTKPTFDASLNYDVNDWWQVYTAGTLHNVLQNGESIAQNIFYGGMEVGSNFHFMRNLDATAFYRLWGYSDNNLEQQAFALVSYRLLPAPYELSFNSSLFFMGFQHTNLLSGKDSVPFPNNALPPGFVHPYFAPNAFFFWENRLSYRGTLSRDLFKYAQHIWYQVDYGLAVDNRNTIYDHFRLSLNWDVYRWLRLGAAADALLSPAYNLGMGYAFLELRWPSRF
jgi:tetratricopeptide (TPR) repeat protein